MRVMTIGEVSAMGAGEIVPSVRGTVTAQYPRTSGTKKDGEQWSMESLQIKDATGTVKVKVWDHPPLGPIKGKSILLSCHEGTKGLSGLKVDENAYKGKTTKEIKVTPTGQVTVEDGAAPASTKPASQPTPSDDSGEWPSEPESNPVPPAAAPAPAPAVAPRPAKSDAEHALFAWAQLYIRCMDSADWLQTQRGAPGHPKMSAEQYHGYCTTMFIECRKCGLGNVK